MMTDNLLLAATQIYLSLVKPQDSPAKRATLRWKAADEALALNEHLLTMERDNPGSQQLALAAASRLIHGNTKVTPNREVLEACLHATGGNVRAAAEMAGIKRTTFWMAAEREGLITPKKHRNKEQ